MKEPRKEIQELTILLDAEREDLANLYYKFGEKLFSDSLDPTTLSGALNNEVFEQWQTLRNERDYSSKAVLEIKSTITRIDELEKFKKELKKQISEEASIYNDQLSLLGNLFINNFSEAELETLDFYSVKLQKEKKNIQQLEEKHSTLKQDAESAGFFSKALAQFKIVGFKSSLKQSKEKFNIIVAEETKKLVESNAFKNNIDIIESHSSISTQFHVVQELKEKIDNLIERDIDLDKDLASMRTVLEQHDAKTNYQNRINVLKGSIKEIDNKLDVLINTSAKEYVDNFLGETGMSLLGTAGEGNEFRDMGMYSHYLEQIGTLRKNIWETSKKIEILETLIKINNLDKNIETYTKTIEDHTKKIEQYKTQITTLEKNTAKAEGEKNKLLEYQKEIEKEIGL